MPSVAFHHSLADKGAYAVRLVRKAHARGARVHVVGTDAALKSLSAALWAQDDASFIAHSGPGAALAAQELSRVVLVPTLENAVLPIDVVVNLSEHVPTGFEQAQRVFELVGADETERQSGKQRWAHYKNSGFLPEAVGP